MLAVLLLCCQVCVMGDVTLTGSFTKMKTVSFLDVSFAYAWPELRKVVVCKSAANTMTELDTKHSQSSDRKIEFVGVDNIMEAVFIAFQQANSVVGSQDTKHSG